MMVPQWLDWELFPQSPAYEFVSQIFKIGEYAWKGMYLGEPPEIKDGSAAFGSDNSAKASGISPVLVEAVGEWAKKWILFYDGEEVTLGIDDGTGDGKRLDLAANIDWEEWCRHFNRGDKANPLNLYDAFRLIVLPCEGKLDMYESATGELMWTEDGDWRWDDEDEFICSKTPSQFVSDIVQATKKGRK